MFLSKLMNWKTAFRLLLLGTILLISFQGAAISSQNRDFVRKNLLDCIGDVPLWYDECLHYTAWPDEKKLIPLKEVPDVKYSYETLINEVMREGLLDKAWREKVVPVKAWIPERSLGRSVDAYLYRQVVDSGTLHICDTRTVLVVAFLADKNQPFEDEPKKFLEQVVQKLFQIKLPSEYEFTKKDDRFFTGLSLFNDKRIPPDVQKRVASKLIGTNRGPSSFSLAYISGARLAIFWLTKGNVSGCRLDRRYPLFRKVSATAYPGELVPFPVIQFRGF